LFIACAVFAVVAIVLGRVGSIAGIRKACARRGFNSRRVHLTNRKERMTIQQDILNEYVLNFKDLPTLTLAKKIKLEKPTYFESVEQIRDGIRQRRGNRGNKSRNQPSVIAPKPNHFIPTEPKKDIPDDAHFDEPRFWLIINDAHIPFHDKGAFATAIDFGIAQGCDSLYCNGDMADNSAFSKWFKDPKHLTPKEDFDDFKTNMKDLAPLFDKKVFKIGNHDDWYNKRLATLIPEMARVDGTSFTDIAKLPEMGFQIIESMQLSFISSMPFLHGHELERGFVSPVNPARGVFMKTYDSMGVAHYHKTSSHVERMALHNKIIATRSVGCLCSLRTSYQTLTKWNWGFATIRVHDSKRYDFSNYIIDDKYNVIQA
jgi:hypothetical protein